MPWRFYQGLDIHQSTQHQIKNKYSITADILSFQLCRRQYGFFTVKNFQPAHLTQIWFGTTAHQVLDKLHLHYSGLLDPRTKGQIPTDRDVANYFNQVNESLKARGVKAISPHLRATALNVLTRFNSIEGTDLYPNVINTELKLQNDQGDFILHGTVDLLKDVSTEGVVASLDPVEIWDYKGSRHPNITRRDGQRKMQRYIYQMYVYAHLYWLKTGRYPRKCILYFLNELAIEPEPESRPRNAIYELDFINPQHIQAITTAMESFSATVNEIENAKQEDAWSPPDERPDEETCNICDIRWDCLAVRGNYPMRHP
ncbi:PD-(D/E)XK nuclease family protein [Methanothrix soehngenii]